MWAAQEMVLRLEEVIYRSIKLTFSEFTDMPVSEQNNFGLLHIDAFRNAITKYTTANSRRSEWTLRKYDISKILKLIPIFQQLRLTDTTSSDIYLFEICQFLREKNLERIVTKIIRQHLHAYKQEMPKCTYLEFYAYLNDSQGIYDAVTMEYLPITNDLINFEEEDRNVNYLIFIIFVLQERVICQQLNVDRLNYEDLFVQCPKKIEGGAPSYGDVVLKSIYYKIPTEVGAFYVPLKDIYSMLKGWNTSLLITTNAIFEGFSFAGNTSVTNYPFIVYEYCNFETHFMSSLSTVIAYDEFNIFKGEVNTFSQTHCDISDTHVCTLGKIVPKEARPSERTSAPKIQKVERKAGAYDPDYEPVSESNTSDYYERLGYPASELQSELIALRKDTEALAREKRTLIRNANTDVFDNIEVRKMLRDKISSKIKEMMQANLANVPVNDEPLTIQNVIKNVSDTSGSFFKMSDLLAHVFEGELGPFVIDDTKVNRATTFVIFYFMDIYFDDFKEYLNFGTTIEKHSLHSFFQYKKINNRSSIGLILIDAMIQYEKSKRQPSKS